jgi:hypothetical protein
MPRKDFNFVSFLLRLLFAMALVFLTYNPSGYSWIGLFGKEVEMVYVAASGIVLLIGWIMFLRAGPGSRLFRYFHLATRPLGTHQSRQSHRDHVGRSDRAVLCAGGRDVLVARTPPDLGPVRYR